MRILIQAVRAVVVELLGVIFVLWLLFGGVTWTLESAGGPRAPQVAPGFWAGLKSSVAAHLTPGRRQAASQSENVGERLDYYSQLYGRAATGYLRQVTENLTRDLSDHQREPRHNHPAQL